MAAYGPHEQTILDRLASQIAPAVENAQLYEQLLESEQELQKLTCGIEQSPNSIVITDMQGKIQPQPQIHPDYRLLLRSNRRKPGNIKIGADFP